MNAGVSVSLKFGDTLGLLTTTTPSLQHRSWKAEPIYILSRGFGIFVETRDGFHTNTIWNTGTRTKAMHIHIPHLSTFIIILYFYSCLVIGKEKLLSLFHLSLQSQNIHHSLPSQSLKKTPTFHGEGEERVLQIISLGSEGSCGLCLSPADGVFIVHVKINCLS